MLEVSTCSRLYNPTILAVTFMIVCCFQGKSQADKTAANRAIWQEWLSKYSKRVQQELAESGAEADVAAAATQRKQMMDDVNPRYRGIG